MGAFKSVFSPEKRRRNEEEIKIATEQRRDMAVARVHFLLLAAIIVPIYGEYTPHQREEMYTRKLEEGQSIISR